MTPAELARSTARAVIHPVYYLFGEEEYLLDRALRALVDAALGAGDRSFNVHTFRGSEHTAAEVTAAANEFPFMAERRVVVLRDAERLMDDEPLAGYLRAPAKESVVILVGAPPSEKGRRKSTAKKKGGSTLQFLQSTGNPFGMDVTVEFAMLKEHALGNWIREEAGRLGFMLSDAALGLMLALKGGGTREIAGDLEKLRSALPDASEITEENLFEHLGVSKRYNVYELSNAVFAQDFPAALEIALTLVDSNGATPLIASLSRDMTMLWQIGAARRDRRPVTDDLVRAVGAGSVWRYNLMAKYLEKVRYPAYFDHCFERLLEADTELKTRRADERTVITRLLHQLTVASRSPH